MAGGGGVLLESGGMLILGVFQFYCVYMPKVSTAQTKYL